MAISNEICNHSLINYFRISAETHTSTHQLMYRKIVCNLNTDGRTSLVF